jgi:Protein of unknown function (DUF2970)
LIVTEPQDKRPRASPLEAAKAVLWAFFGIRKRKDYDSDAVRLTPAQVIVAGIIGAVVFVLTLVLLVRFVTG